MVDIIHSFNCIKIKKKNNEPVFSSSKSTPCGNYMISTLLDTIGLGQERIEGVVYACSGCVASVPWCLVAGKMAE